MRGGTFVGQWARGRTDHHDSLHHVTTGDYFSLLVFPVTDRAKPNEKKWMAPRTKESHQRERYNLSGRPASQHPLQQRQRSRRTGCHTLRPRRRKFQLSTQSRTRFVSLLEMPTAQSQRGSVATQLGEAGLIKPSSGSLQCCHHPRSVSSRLAWVIRV